MALDSPKFVRTLFLDFASHRQLIALVDKRQTISQQPIDGKGESVLIPAIEQLIGQSMVNHRRSTVIDRIAAVTGPGGFMSLRVGISLANALSDGLKIPLAGMHLSDLWKARLPPPSSPNPFSPREKGLGVRVGPPPLPAGEGLGVRVVWLHSTKREFLFVRGFGEFEKQWPQTILLSTSALQEFLQLNQKPETRNQKPVSYVGELIESQQASLPMLKPLENITTLEEVLPEVLNNLVYEQKSLLPWYGRGA